MGNNIFDNFNNFCGCKDNEESEKSKIEKVIILIITNKLLYLFNSKDFHYRISKKQMSFLQIAHYQAQKIIL
jgi:hypothetical protein